MACRRLALLTLVVGFALAPAMGLATTIYDVQYNETTQGTGDDCYPSPLDAQQVTVSGIVTAVVPGAYPNFWIEEAAGGAWRGVYVYDTTVDPARGDLRIQGRSAARDRADPSYAPAHDLDGQSRPRGTRPDLGADEMAESVSR